MSHIRKQLKARRKALGFKQEDMLLRVGMSRQQYQKLESKGNPSLSTLELVAKGLKLELLLIPQEKLTAVKALLNSSALSVHEKHVLSDTSDDPWKNILDEDAS